MSFDDKKVLKDLFSFANYLNDTPSKSVVKNDLERFISLNNLHIQLTGYGIDLDYLNVDFNKLRKEQLCELRKFGMYCLKSRDTIINIMKNSCDLVDQYPINKLFVTSSRGYNQKDCIDLILSYFSTYGNKAYYVAKKYFDENRILVNYSEDANIAGHFSGIVREKSGYVCLADSRFNSFSASLLCHELGHAYDYETFIFPQQKKKNIISDVLLEVPSCVFEIGFANYLIDNHVDIVGATSHALNRFYQIGYGATDIEMILKNNSINIDINGNAIYDGECYSFRDTIVYALGYYFGFVFDYIKSNTSQKEYNKIFDKLLTSRIECGLEQSINNLDIPVDEFTSCAYLRKRLDKLYLE